MGVSEKSDVSAAEPANREHEYLSGPKLVTVLVAVTLAFFLVMLDTSIVATAIPQITTDFHSLSDVGWYGSAYQLANAAFQPLTGKIYMHFSTKWTFLSFFAVFQIGSALCGAAQSSPMFIVGRAVAGLGSSGLMNGALVIWSSCVIPSRLPILQALLVSVGQVGVAGGPLLGGALTERVTWRWCFYINLPVGAVTATLLALISISEQVPKAPPRIVLRKAIHSLDLLGFALFALAATMFFFALEFGGNQYGWDSAVVIGLLCGAFATFVVFFTWEWYCGEAAMVPFSILQLKLVWSSALSMSCFLGTMFTVAYYLPIWLQTIKGDSPLMSGVHNIPMFVSQVIVLLISGGMAQRIGHCLPSALFGTMLASIGAGLLSTLKVSSNAGRWIGFQIIYGVGVGSVVQMPFISFQCLIPRPKIPSAMAILILTQYFGAALWVTVAQNIFSNSMQSLIPKYAPGVDASTVVAGGARAVRERVEGKQLQGVLMAYSISFDRVMYLSASLAAVAFVFAWGLGLQSIRKVRVEAGKAEVDVEGEKSGEVERG